VDTLRVAQVEAVNTITLDMQFGSFSSFFIDRSVGLPVFKTASTYSQNYEEVKKKQIYMLAL
jgi:hypothetical protein